ncbi:hypothetical protein HCY95_01814 [Limosilactobacillus fermentum]|uniref:Uncharacterized protein n=1 Tax=Limosilactobacillus fermentum TaxID=1613 RepID=A0AAJ4GHQ6_LIMFE|nr:hypothetical protein HCY95_01814 [Limosilactobacillus fermentum]
MINSRNLIYTNILDLTLMRFLELLPSSKSLQVTTLTRSLK